MNVAETLKEIADGCTHASTGEAFFQSLALYLYKGLQVDYVFIGELKDVEKQQIIHSVAFCAKGKLVDPVEYPVVGSLCEYVLQARFCAFPSQVQQQFPHNESLKYYNVDAYAGIPLVSTGQKVMGLIYVMHRKPLTNLDLIESILNIVAKRAEMEMERIHQEKHLERQQKELTYARQALAEASQNLEMQVMERTRKLSASEEKLRHSVENLGEREAFLASIIDQTIVGIALVDLTGQFIFVNEGYCKIVGWSQAQLYTKNLTEITHPDDLPNNLVLLQSLKQEGTPFEIEKRYIRGDGSLVWCLINVSMVRQAPGHLPRILAVCQDITSRKRTELELIQAKERFSLVSKATNDAIWDWDLKTGQLWWNEGFSTMFGYQPAQIEKSVESWYSRIHPHDRKRIVDDRRRVIDFGGKQWSAEYRFRRADGSYAYILDRGYALHDKEGKPYRMIGSILDLTERKQADEALRRLSAEYRFLADSVPTLVWRTLPNGQADYFNGRWFDYTGLTYIQSKNAGWHVVVHPDDLQRTIQAWQHSVTTGEDYRIEYRLRQADGSFRWFLGHGLPLKDDQDTIVLWVGTATDIHDQKIAQYTLENTLKELHEKNYELDQFVYKTSHDLRAPLTTIMGLVSILKNEKDELTKARYVDLIESRVNKLDLFIKSMLDYSRNTRTASRIEKIPVEELIKECIDELEYMRNFNRLHISLHIEEKELYSDVFRLKIIFSNLISNAIKYQDYNKPESILTIEVKTDGSYYLIVFTDNGVGIDQAYQDRIFSMFFRAAEQSEGSGLGLYIVKQAAGVLQGSIDLKSEAGKGTQFIITLPKLSST